MIDAPMHHEEKVKLIRLAWYALLRSTALAVFIVASLRSGYGFEIQAMLIAGAVAAYCSAASLAALVELAAERQSVAAHFAQLSYVSTEIARLAPDSQEPAKLVAERIEQEDAARMPLGFNTRSDAWSSGALEAAARSTVTIGGIVAVWYGWPYLHHISSRISQLIATL